MEDTMPQDLVNTIREQLGWRNTIFVKVTMKPVPPTEHVAEETRLIECEVVMARSLCSGYWVARRSYLTTMNCYTPPAAVKAFGRYIAEELRDDIEGDITDESVDYYYNPDDQMTAAFLGQRPQDLTQ